MKTRHILSCAAVSILLTPAIALAQEDSGDLEATIRLMDKAEAELPDAVTREIRLPASVREDSAAVAASAKGQEQANEAKLNREKGQSVAAEARGNASSDARENANEMAEAARENAANRSRSDEHRPDRPDRPNQPNNP